MHKENYENIIKFYRNEGNTLDLISVKLNTINNSMLNLKLFVKFFIKIL